jgi:hypothetical protein
MVLSGIAFAVVLSFTWLCCVATNSCDIGFVTVFSMIAHAAAAATLQGSDTLPPIQYGSSSRSPGRGDFTWVYCVATNPKLIFSIFLSLSR